MMDSLTLKRPFQIRIFPFIIFLFLLQTISTLDAYTRPSHVSENVWSHLEPYFLPENHKIKKKLDKIFSKRRVFANEDTASKAGFLKTSPGRQSHIVVSKHEDIKGFIFKFFYDSEAKLDWPQMFQRVTGAISVKNRIKENKWEDTFKVPKKWIYPIPIYPQPLPGTEKPKSFLLVAEDMEIFTKSLNRMLWNTKTTPEILDKVYLMLEQEGLVDSALPMNMPYSKDGKIAIIDLEYHHIWPVPFYKITHYLSDENQAYWLQLIENKGPGVQ